MLHLNRNKTTITDYAKRLLATVRRQRLDAQSKFFAVSSIDAEGSEGVAALLRQMPTPGVPADLAFKVRLLIGQERSRMQRPSWGWRWWNSVAPFAAPAMAGLLCAVVTFGALIHAFEFPVQASSDDVPLNYRTVPRLRSSGPLGSDTGVRCMVVQILIDENGRVADFQVIGGKQTPQEVRHVQNLLLFAQFDPATVFGKPTAETVVLALRDGRLKGYSL